jgi:hypothetical protein
MTTAEIAAECQRVQRLRAQVMKSRIALENQLRATVAVHLGYVGGGEEKASRTEKFEAADALIDRVDAGGDDPALGDLIRANLIAVRGDKKLHVHGFQDKLDGLDKELEKLAARLPVAAWVKAADQRGFGLKSMGVVVGECGDLANYANPAKVWKRMGCAPWQFNGETRMGSTWKSGKEGKLPGEEWERFGYSPRRRSVMYVIGENLLKLNRGPYRARYDGAKATIQAAHPDYSKMRCHRHGMLLAVKLLLKNLWVEWNRRPAEGGGETEVVAGGLLCTR